MDEQLTVRMPAELLRDINEYRRKNTDENGEMPDKATVVRESVREKVRGEPETATERGAA